jgi:hypothetical protein
MAKRTTPPTTAAGADDDTIAVASNALGKLPDDATARVIAAGLQTMSPDAQGELLERLASPDQKVTNDIWRWIVATFAVVLIGATAALVASVVVSFWHAVDTAMVQIILTIFTTTAGILAGFVSGRASSTRARTA